MLFCQIISVIWKCIVSYYVYMIIGLYRVLWLESIKQILLEYGGLSKLMFPVVVYITVSQHIIV